MILERWRTKTENHLALHLQLFFSNVVPTRTRINKILLKLTHLIITTKFISDVLKEI